MRAFIVRLFVACAFVAVTGNSALAQNGASRAQVDALLNAYEGVDPAQWRSLGAAAVPILESIATDQGVLPTRRARSLDALAMLGAGQATMRGLANSTAAPLIVRMSAIRGLGQLLSPTVVIEALRPLLSDTQWQIRGTAAETLSNTPGGCAAVTNMAKRETEAWRSRFVARCAQPGSSAPTLLQPDAPTAYDPTARIVTYRIYDSTPTKIYDYGSASSLAKVAIPIGLGAFSVLMPNSPALAFSSGTWEFDLLASKATDADVSGMIKTPLSAGLNSGTLNANLFFVGVPGLTAGTAPANAVFQTLLAKVNTTYAQAGLQLGTVKYIDITGADATTFTDIDQTTLYTLMKLSSNGQASDGAINLFFVHSIGGGAPGYVILGESTGIPGVPMRGTSGSGVAVTMADFPNGLDELALTIAHEGGHWLGLFHTTESSGTAFDPLGDTPQCPAATYDTNHDSTVDAAECAGQDASNLMFWTSSSGPQPSLLTSDQKFVLLRNPTVNVPNTQVNVTAYGPVAVQTAQFSKVFAAVPADAASLTLVGIVPETRVIVPNPLRYVNATATGANNGTSWTDAYTDLAAALTTEVAGTQFWVAKGTYKPTAAANRSAAFVVKPGMAIYGGFAGTETQLSQRNLVANPTVLSGDIDNNDTGANGVDADTTKIVGNNAYHVIVLDGTTGTISSGTILDGLTITGGQADGASPDDRGGGVLCNTACDATLTNLYFAGNYAAYVGGAFYHEGASSPIVTNTTFAGNAASNGGAVYDILGPGTAPVYANVTFAGNSVTAYGGAMYNYQTTGSASLALTNVTFSGNSAAIGGAGIAHYNCGATLTSAFTNTIIWGNTPDQVIFVCDTPTFKNSVLQDSGAGVAWNGTYGVDGGGNVATDPLLRPQKSNGGSMPTMLPGLSGSAIDAGLDSACTAAPVNGLDQRGVARPFGTHCDIGAVELTTLTVNSTADPGDGVCDGTCTLRDAIAATQFAGATAHDVVFDASFNTPKTVNLAATLPNIVQGIAIHGPAANLLTVRRDTGGDYRIFTIYPTADVGLSGMTIANGKSASTGGGIENYGALTIDRCTLSGNVAATTGGAIESSGLLAVTNSTFSGNSAKHGGALFNYSTASACLAGCPATLTNTTISGNATTSYAAAIEVVNFGGIEPTVTLLNSTVAGNLDPIYEVGIIAWDSGGAATVYLQNTIVADYGGPTSQDLATGGGANGQVVSLGNNLALSDGGGYFVAAGDLVNTDPLLALLAYYGGATPTLYPKPGSPAINAGDDLAAPDIDQRGVLRPVGAHVDIGAVESEGILIFQNGFD